MIRPMLAWLWRYFSAISARSIILFCCAAASLSDEQAYTPET